MTTKSPFPKNRRSALKKRRESRSKARCLLHEHRQRLISLKCSMKEGGDFADDVDSCKGQINLLLKEIQSIDEGGHTTFLLAKKWIAPKEGISSKKTNLRQEKHKLKTELSDLQKRLGRPSLSDTNRQEILGLIHEKNKLLDGFETELHALKQYNHTRFVSAREENARQVEAENALYEIQRRKAEVDSRMLVALEQADEILIGRLYEELKLL